MQRNILLLMTDQQRADYVGYAPHGQAVTPQIDSIAAHARFTCCQTTNPICTPARSSLITGRYSRQIGTLTMSGDLFPQIPTFMQALQKTGYRTYGIGKFHYLQTTPWNVPRGGGMRQYDWREETRRFGYDYIWETAGKQQLDKAYCFYAHYLDDKGMLDEVRDFLLACGGDNGDTADHNYDKALAWPFDEEDYVDVVTGRVAREQLQQHPHDTPFYMKVSFCGPHKPYDAPPRYLAQFPLEEVDDFIAQDDVRVMTADEKQAIYRQRRSAKAMLRLIDDQIGEILNTLRVRGMLEDTLVLFTSDHGDMLGDHFMLQKGVPWRQALNVPLAVQLPHTVPIGVCHMPVELSDLAATILDYAGLDPQAALGRAWPAYNNIIPSRSLLPVLRGESESVRDFAFSESDFSEERAGSTTPGETIRNRGGAGRSNAWQCITTEHTKYMKYLGYALGEAPVEEFYDMENDPCEMHNEVENPFFAVQVAQARSRLMFMVDHFPPVQKTWAGGTL